MTLRPAQPTDGLEATQRGGGDAGAGLEGEGTPQVAVELAEGGGAAAIADGIARLLANSEQAQQQGEAGRKIAETVTWDATIARLLAAGGGK